MRLATPAGRAAGRGPLQRVGEDSQDATFAGQQETYLWVQGVERLCDAVRDCWVSLYSPTAVSYRARLGQARSRRWASPCS